MVSYYGLGQLNWQEVNTGASTSTIISVGNISIWGMSAPTLNGQDLPEGSLIGVFFLNDDDEYVCGGVEPWIGGDNNIALTAWGTESGLDNGFAANEVFTFFVRVCDGPCFTDSGNDGNDVYVDSFEVADGTDYIALSPVMVSPTSDNDQIDTEVYTDGGLAGLQSADFTEYVDLEECSCADGTPTAVVAGVVCQVIGGCSDPGASNYSDCYFGSYFPTFSNEICEDSEVVGCTCNLSYNYNPDATEDDGTCVVISGGCGDATALNYSGDICSTAIFLANDCVFDLPEPGPMEYVITDANMTVQVSSNVILLNGEPAPLGSKIGAYYTNNEDELVNAGYEIINGEDQYAIAVWASESGLDNGFAAGEEITWVLQVGNDFLLADAATMNSAPPFSETFVANGFGQVLSVQFSGDVVIDVPGCTEESAYNYNSAATFDDGSCYSLDDLEFDFTITDANMTIQVAQSAVTFNGIGNEPSCGSLLGGFYTNQDGQLLCGGYQVWCDDFSNNQLAIALWQSEAGMDNGFDSGEEIIWVLSVGGQNFIAESSTMNPAPPFENTYTANGFGQLLVAEFFGDILGCIDASACNYNSDATIDDNSCEYDSCLGCIDESACNYNSEATIDNNSCISPIMWYYDTDGDTLGDELYPLATLACDLPGIGYVDNNDDPCPEDFDNIPGCTDENSANYNPDACFDDDSCILVVEGCTDDTALNFNPLANSDDGSCIAIVLGCTDPTSFNYNVDANTDDGSCCTIAGCTDENSINYDPDACFDNNNCVAIVLGCTDPLAFNYDEYANTNDGSCEAVVLGCIDNLACNYNEEANTIDGSCIYAETYYDCNDVCLNDEDNDGVCDELEILGCTDNTAFNYDSSATDDDGSCEPIVFGCIDPSSFNYNPLANTDDGSCCYIEGCTDENSINYNPNTCFDDGSCIAIVLGCTDPLAFNYNENANIDDGSCIPFIYGCIDELACNFDASANTDDGSCLGPDQFYDCDGNCLEDIDGDGVCDPLEVGGCTDVNALNYNPEATEDGICIFTGCLDASACNFDPNGVFNEPVDCDYESCVGCTNSAASNYNPNAIIDNGSCIIYDCTDASACNYNPDATEDDGSCDYSCFGCTDETAYNYNPDATEDDGSCEPVVLGCLDIIACNYDSTFNTSDGSCEYPVEGFDCDGNQLALDTPWGNNSGCAFNNHVVGFSSPSFNSGDYIGVFYLDDNGSLVFSQGVEYTGSNFAMTICSDDATTTEKDGFDVGESFFWQIWPAGEDCSYPINVEYSENQPSSSSFEVEGVSEIIAYTESPLSVSVLVSDVSCFGHFDGFATLDITGGIPFGDDSYIIDGQLDNLNAGNYSVTITDYNGCQEIVEFIISEPDPLQLSLNGSDYNGFGVSCNGASDGWIDLEVTGGTGNYTYNWDNGSETQDLENIGAGTYIIIVTDDNECSVASEFVVSEPEDELQISGSTSDYNGFGVSCNGASDGFIDVTVSGGVGNYTYSWSNGATSQNLNNLEPGTYVLIVIDDNGCSADLSFVINEPDLFLINFETSPGEYSNCSSGSASILVTGGTAPYQYLWSNGSIESEITALCGGEYSVTVTDGNGCVVEQEVTVDYLSPEGWDINETDLSHIINIPLDAVMLLDQVDLTPGDYIGVFFDNEDGTQACGGYAMWIGETTQLIAYGNDGVNNGFEDLEQFKWRVWDNETETEAHGFVVYDETYPSERYFSNGGESGVLASVFATYQMIPLNENPYTDWDIISTYINSEEDVQSMFVPILEELVIIKDANGLVYWPDWEINTLVNLNNHDAYGVKTWSPNELIVQGDFIQPEDIVFDLSGWNYISYPRYLSMSLEDALSSVLGNIKLLKDDSGNVYWPELNINTVEQMSPGEGYVLKVFEDQSFSYPSNSDGSFNLNDLVGWNNSGRIGLDRPLYYSDFQKTNNNMTIGVPLNVWNNFDIQNGDEIAALDTEGNIFGAAVLSESNNVLVVWGDDEFSLEKDGMLSGEELLFELWDESSNKVYDLQFTWQEGDDKYNINGINIASNAIVSNQDNQVFDNIKCYPNPNTGSFNIELLLNNKTDVVIDVFNAIGKKVHTLDCGPLNMGSYNLPIALKNVGQGMYYIEFRSSLESKQIIFNITD